MSAMPFSDLIISVREATLDWATGVESRRVLNPVGATYANHSRLDPATACVLAAAVTSLKMEKPGPYDGDRTALDTRLGEAYGGVSIALPA